MSSLLELRIAWSHCAALWGLFSAARSAKKPSSVSVARPIGLVYVSVSLLPAGSRMDGTMTGYDTNLAAEFYALSCLHRLGLTAALTLGNKRA